MAMAKFDLEVTFTLSCGDCGKDLSCVRTWDRGGSTEIEVRPCSYCLSDARDAGDADGYERGKEEASEDNG